MTDTNPLAPIEALLNANAARLHRSGAASYTGIGNTALSAALAEARQAVDALVAERDAAREALARVEEAVSETRSDNVSCGGMTLRAEGCFVRDLALRIDAALTQPANPDVGERCGECRLGLGVHRPSDPRCRHHVAQPATDEEAGQ